MLRNTYMYFFSKISTHEKHIQTFAVESWTDQKLSRMTHPAERSRELIGKRQTESWAVLFIAWTHTSTHMTCIHVFIEIEICTSEGGKVMRSFAHFCHIICAKQIIERVQKVRGRRLVEAEAEARRMHLKFEQSWQRQLLSNTADAANSTQLNK